MNLLYKTTTSIMDEIKFVVVEPKKEKEETDVGEAYEDLMKTIEAYEHMFKEILGKEIEEVKVEIVKSLKGFNRELKDKARTKMRA